MLPCLQRVSLHFWTCLQPHVLQAPRCPSNQVFCLQRWPRNQGRFAGRMRMSPEKLNCDENTWSIRFFLWVLSFGVFPWLPSRPLQRLKLLYVEGLQFVPSS